MSRYTQYFGKNNVKSELAVGISSIATTIQVNENQGNLRGENFPVLGTLEHFDSTGKCTKREIVKVESKSGDSFTVVRKFAPCPPSDDATSQSAVSSSFDPGDSFSIYIPYEVFNAVSEAINDLYNNGNDRLFAKKTSGLGFEITPGNVRFENGEGYYEGGTGTVVDNSVNYVMLDSSFNIVITQEELLDVQNISIAEITAVNGEITQIISRKIDGIAGRMGGGGDPIYGDGSDGDLVISENTILNAGQQYNFSNLTICSGATLSFTGCGGAKIHVSNLFCNMGTIDMTDLNIASYSYRDSTSFCCLCNTLSNVGTIVYGAGGYGHGGNLATNKGGNSCPDGNACVGSGGAINGAGGIGCGGCGGGGGGGMQCSNYNTGATVGSAGSGCNGGNGGNGSGATGTNCPGGGGGGGGGGGYGGNGGNGGNGGTGGHNGGGGNGGNGGNSGILGKGGKGGTAGYYNAVGGNGGNGYCGGDGGDGRQNTCRCAINSNLPGCRGGNGGMGYFGGKGGTGGRAMLGRSQSGYTRPFCCSGPGGAGGKGLVGGNGGIGGVSGIGCPNSAGYCYHGVGGNGGAGGNGISALHSLNIKAKCFCNLGCILSVGGVGGNGGQGGNAIVCSGNNYCGKGGNGGAGGNGGPGGQIQIITQNNLCCGCISIAGGLGGTGGIAGTGLCCGNGTAGANGTAGSSGTLYFFILEG